MRFQGEHQSQQSQINRRRALSGRHQISTQCICRSIIVGRTVCLWLLYPIISKPACIARTGPKTFSVYRYLTSCGLSRDPAWRLFHPCRPSPSLFRPPITTLDNALIAGMNNAYLFFLAQQCLADFHVRCTIADSFFRLKFQIPSLVCS